MSKQQTAQTTTVSIGTQLHSINNMELNGSDNYLGVLTELTVLYINGEAATQFLQGQFTCDINELQQAEARVGSYCDYKGRVLANFWIWPWQQGYALILPQDMLVIIQEQLKKYALFSKITLMEAKNWHTLLYCHRHDTALPNHLLIQGNINIPNSEYILTWLFGTTAACNELIQQLKPQVMTIDEKSCLLLQILSGFSFIQTGTSLVFTPQMLGLEKLGAVSFRKGCYVGQEVIARTQHLGKLKRHIHRCFISATLPPTAGKNLQNHTQEAIATIVTSAALSNGHIFLAVIQDQALQQDIYFDGQKVTILE